MSKTKEKEPEEFSLEYYVKKDAEKKARAREASRNYYQRNRDQKVYNDLLSAEGFEEMKKAQDGACAICTARPKTLCVDHNHETGKIRGLLCRKCNLGLGLFLDDPIHLKSAAEYLLLHQEEEA